jgi:hypothetical protein
MKSGQNAGVKTPIDRIRCQFRVGAHNLPSMKPSLLPFTLAAAVMLANGFHVSSLASSPPPIPMNQLGAVAGKQYQGDGLLVQATAMGANLRCVFQRLEGEVTAEGLWLRSTADNSSGERFRVLALAVGREFGDQHADWFGVPPSGGPARVNAELRATGFGNLSPFAEAVSLSGSGSVNVTDQVARFRRPGLTEEYSVSVDGVRQDFLIAQPPTGTGELRLELDVTGATVEPLGNGVRLTLRGSGRQLAYHRLHVTDATGRELPARMEVASGILPDVEGAHPAARNSRATSLTGYPEATPESAGLEATALRQAEMPAATKLAVLVDDANAVYPVRIDPTFSDADWIGMGGIVGANDRISEAVVDDAGNLYIAGHFTAIGNVVANRIAKWDGVTWSGLGAGMNSYINALAVSGTNLYAGGWFTTAGSVAAKYIAKWNGSAWSSLGSGLNSGVSALAASGSDLYAGGSFNMAGGNSANRVAKWDGSAWSALGSGVNNYVFTLAIADTNLYASGWFTTAGGLPASRIAKWNGNVWSSLGAGLGGSGRYHRAYALAIVGTNLYAGGDFTTAGEVAVKNIARWNGSEWSALGSGVNAPVSTLALSGTSLYAGGSFTMTGGTPANYIAKWDGSSWSTLGLGLDSSVAAIASSGSDLYVVGEFSTAGSAAANQIAMWNGNDWSAVLTNVPLGLNGSVRAVAVVGADVYAGGSFTMAGGNPANRIAKWNGSSWSTLGAGLNNTVYALATLGTNLYVGGIFDTADDITVNHIARWDGSAWSALGSGVDNTVLALAVLGTNLYAGGRFFLADDINASRIAKWDGTMWSALSSGVDGGSWQTEIRALATSGMNLFAGGDFTVAGGNSANGIARWDGATWSALGSGISGSYPFVFALAVSGTDLYAGGEFRAAGGTPVNCIAKWNGNAWSALGEGMDYSVYALAVSGTDLYAGGYFTEADGNAVSMIAKWDGNTWSTMGSGMGGGGESAEVYTLAVSGTNLYVGGNFTTAGDKVSAFAAAANIGVAPGRLNDSAYSSIAGFSCTFLDASVGQPYRIQTSSSLLGPWTDFTNFVYIGPVVISDPAPLVGTNKFFRAVTP